MAVAEVLNENYFLTRSTIDPETGCWTWKLFRNRSGYGKCAVSLGGLGEQIAHRLAYRALVVNGAPIVGEIDHLCRNRGCVNPDHLEDVPHQVNMQRAPYNSYIAPRAAQTHCVNGHEYTVENTGRTRTGDARYCRTCKRAQQARFAEKKRAHAGTLSPRATADQGRCILGGSTCGTQMLGS